MVKFRFGVAAGVRDKSRDGGVKSGVRTGRIGVKWVHSDSDAGGQSESTFRPFSETVRSAAHYQSCPGYMARRGSQSETQVAPALSMSPTTLPLLLHRPDVAPTRPVTLPNPIQDTCIVVTCFVLILPSKYSRPGQPHPEAESSLFCPFRPLPNTSGCCSSSEFVFHPSRSLL
jgi:hypothetical protein